MPWLVAAQASQRVLSLLVALTSTLVDMDVDLIVRFFFLCGVLYLALACRMCTRVSGGFCAAYNMLLALVI